MLPASRAACVPVFIATPTSAWASAGASLVPSPHIATSLPLACSSRISLSLASGVAWARKSSTPASAAIAAAVSGLSPVIITVRMPIRRSSAKRSRMPPLTMSLSWMTPSSAAVVGHGQRRAAAPWRCVSAPRCSSRRDRGRPGACAHVDDGVDRALADRRAVDVDAAHAGLRGERHEAARAAAPCRAPRMPYFSLASTTIERPSGVSSASEASCAASASSCSVDAGHRHELGRLAVAERDGAGLVEQQRVDVARRLDRAARHGEHVEAHQPVHAGDADGRQQRADRGRDQGDEQRDQHDHRDRAAGIGGEARDA